MKTNMIYITAGSMDEARVIGKELVSTRLAACVNIIDGITLSTGGRGKSRRTGR